MKCDFTDFLFVISLEDLSIIFSYCLGVKGSKHLIHTHLDN